MKFDKPAAEIGVTIEAFCAPSSTSRLHRANSLSFRCFQPLVLSTFLFPRKLEYKFHKVKILKTWKELESQKGLGSSAWAEKVYGSRTPRQTIGALGLHSARIIWAPSKKNDFGLRASGFLLHDKQF